MSQNKSTEKRGRPPVKENRQMVSMRLPQDIIRWMRTQRMSQSQLVENAMRVVYDINDED